MPLPARVAAVAMALQTIRHHIDFAFHEAKRGAPAGTPYGARSARSPVARRTSPPPGT